jgi:hypothetical protein
MFRAATHEFGFTMRRTSDGNKLEGTSVRYGAIVLLGAGHLDEARQRPIFGGESASEFCDRLIRNLDSTPNLGDVALITWAAALLDRPELGKAMACLKQRMAAATDVFTVEIAWALSALSQAQPKMDVKSLAGEVKNRLMKGYSPSGGLFGHVIGSKSRGVRAHVGCFADQVYPIQALSRFHHAFDDSQSLATAARCAKQICAVQGTAGQWWWHYDIRTGDVLEGYPVYSVHQNSMAPMALLDLLDAGGPDYSAAMRLGVKWMEHAPEVGRSLIDEPNHVIWRKVGRSDPKKLVRKIRAGASWVHPRLRLQWINGLLPPRTIDFESRPYHLGWVLHAWLGSL